MSIQKYRADFAHPASANGAIEWFSRWMGGPTLAKVSNCPTPDGPRTVYITGEPDTYFSVPAACYVGRRYVRGYVTGTEDGPEFCPHLQCAHENAWREASRAA
jgi:hypothetical protein